MSARWVVRAPASSANLGPGFDSFAIALGLHLTLKVEESSAFALESDLPVERGRENLCVRAFEWLWPSDGLTFTVRSEIPVVGGLGSSAAAIVAGMLAAKEVAGLDVDLLGEAAGMEGHPDNVAASLLGGFVICANGGARRLSPPEGLAALLAVPEEPVRTEEARAALPEQVLLSEASFNVAHGALLAAGMAIGDLEMVSAGLADRLHQQRRAKLFPRSYELMEQAERLGALGGTISGAGPAVMIWCESERVDEVESRLEQRVAGWARLMRAPLEGEGACVVEDDASAAQGATS